MDVKIIMLLIVFLFFGCNKKNDNEAIPINYISTNETLLKKEIIERGDTASYQTLWYSYLDNPQLGEFLYYAMVMANKYDYPQAYYDVYLCLTSTTSIDSLDYKTKELVIDYLTRASKKGHTQATSILEELSPSIK